MEIASGENLMRERALVNDLHTKLLKTKKRSKQVIDSCQDIPGAAEFLSAAIRYFGVGAQLISFVDRELQYLQVDGNMCVKNARKKRTRIPTRAYPQFC